MDAQISQVVHNQDIALFDSKQIVAGTGVREYEAFKPDNFITIAGCTAQTLTFSVKKEKHKWFDLFNSFIEYDLEILKKNAAGNAYEKLSEAAPDANDVAFIDLIGFTAFRRVQFWINNVLAVRGSGEHYWLANWISRSFLESCNKVQKKFLEEAGYYPDKPSDVHKAITADLKASTNTGLNKRYEKTKNGAVWKISAPLGEQKYL